MPVKTNAELAIDSDASTLFIKQLDPFLLWQGETMDYGMAIDALLACQEKSVVDAYS